MGPARDHIGPMSETMESTAAVVVHRYPMVCLGIRFASEQSRLFRVVGEAVDPEKAFDLIDASRPAVVILGMQFPNRTGFDVLRDLKARWPTLRVLIFCDVPMPDFPERCLRSGADGYVDMSEPIGNFVQAVSKIQRGQVYLSEERSTALLSRLTHRDRGGQPRLPVERLSDSELGVLTLISRGMSNREIAAALHRSLKTVETYRTRIKRKVGVGNATALARFAVMHISPNYLEKAAEPHWPVAG
jgi:DNA-binding NarL/FixJ family response regulator